MSATIASTIAGEGRCFHTGFTWSSLLGQPAVFVPAFAEREPLVRLGRQARRLGHRRAVLLRSGLGRIDETVIFCTGARAHSEHDRVSGTGADDRVIDTRRDMQE